MVVDNARQDLLKQKKVHRKVHGENKACALGWGKEVKSKKSKFIEQSSQNVAIVEAMKVLTAYTEMGSIRSKWILFRVQTKHNLTALQTRMRNKDNSSSLDWGWK